MASVTSYSGGSIASFSAGTTVVNQDEELLEPTKAVVVSTDVTASPTTQPTKTPTVETVPEEPTIAPTASKYAQEIEDNYTKTEWTITRRYYNYQRVTEPTYEGNVDFLKDWLYMRNLWMINHFEPFAGEYEIGDADGDGIVDVLDATVIQRKLAYLDMDKAAMVHLRGDLDFDGLTVLDATRIQRKIAGL